MSQVGGHPTIHFSPDNSLLFKPTNAQEIEFYQALTTRPELTRLRWFTPEFLGTLRLEGGIPQDKEKKEVPADEPVVSDKADDSAEIGQHDVKSLALGEETSETRAQAVRSTESVVLTNLTQAFTHPSVLDVKLGTVLYDEHASPEKKARMEKAAQDTTSGSCGIRLVGFSNWDPSNQTSIMTDKAFGKALTPETLPSGIARFFPLKTSSSTSGLSSSLLLEVLQNIHLDLTTIHSILLETEARLVRR
ncbi:Inositol polyphosphate multikinase, component of the ARGR transcription regulatory complex [Phaffia rhodozyma]|uniref:Kinase n=1 Tax=Phaffia rhodozyma TaxID=264483 RepID=A0A0F7STR6_PHARH|nr:Inositol polyphosphate multikinase, component of the ARGR transcription regulatory complex [Phaffia rhodozyma]